MAKFFSEIGDDHRDFILRQKVFFTASAATDTRVNLSPKGLDTLRILGRNSVCYLDYTGSGNETAAHLLADGRLTLMFCAFEGAPMILRLFGRGQALQRDEAGYQSLLAAHFGGETPTGVRQIITLAVEMVQTACGFGVPLMDYRADRETMPRLMESKGEAGLREYRALKNRVSLDGLPTGLREPA
ncbi:MAG: pyridoxamine 5'-phosphate oxidase family protein [Proteobacteria bacterium]|nr:pyridoxamine 5'-phosphate oxidase family protein [Pseudomonadota bacterium]